MEDKLVEVILQALQYDSFLAALLLGAQGFSLARIWPESSAVPSLKSIVCILPGFGVACYCLYIVADHFARLSLAVGEHKVPTFTAAWINEYWQFYVLFAISVFLTATGLAVGTKLRR